MRKNSTLKIGVSGIRGVVGESLTPSLVADFAASFGVYVGKGLVLVGRDTRPTGAMIEKAVVAGLVSVGCRPLTLGIAPTPTIQINVPALNARGAVAITASHNPEEWNALKLIGLDGILLNSTETIELLDIYNQPDTAFVIEDEFRRPKPLPNAFQTHEKRVFNAVDVELIRSACLKVAVDSCDGAGAPYAVGFLENLGCGVVTLFDSTAGKFRREPEPIPKNLSVLSKTVSAEKCDIGFAQDPDADRLAVVDETGAPVSEQYSIVLAAEHVLSRNPGDLVVNIGTTKAADDIAARHGGAVHHSKIGEINVIDMMRAENAVIGGEGGSGGIIYPAVHHCRDSFTGMALILEMMAERKLSLTRILKDLPLYRTANVKVACSAEKARRLIRTLTRKHRGDNIKTIDGLRIDWDDRWVLLRPSNTEPIIRITAEAESAEFAAELANQFAAELEGLE
ncbi:MAG: phosphoglucosamine mutase [Kiritimatiellaeota bacterium]|nr:phosphoglucosamine mutase [Kiritimatiellota bacterium]